MQSTQTPWLLPTYAALSGLFCLYVLLPGGPTYETPGHALLGSGVNALIVWRLWHRSAAAWFIGVLIWLLGSLSIMLMGSALEVWPVLVFTVAQLAILLSGPVRAYVWSGPRLRVAPS